MISRSVFSRLLVASLVVITAAAGPGVGTASASSTGCDELDQTISDFSTVLASGPTAIAAGYEAGSDVATCATEPKADDAVTNLTAVDADQVRADVHSTALDEAADNELALTNYHNDLNSTDPVVWMDIETATARHYLDGATQTQTRTNAEQIAADGYSARAINLIEQWNTTASEVGRMVNVTDSEANVSEDYVYVPEQDEYVIDEYVEVEISGTSTTTVTLPNGTSHPAETIEVYVYATDNPNDGRYFDVGPTGHYEDATFRTNSDIDNVDPKWRVDLNSVVVRPPTDSQEPVTLVDFYDYEDAWNRTHDQSADLQAEADTFVSNTYTAYDSGEIDANEVISRNTAMFNLAADEVSANNSMYRSTAALGMMGLDVPDLNSTGTMTVDYRQTEYNGLLLAESAPAGQWSAGTTYDTANIGVTYLVTTSGELITLDGQFTLLNMTNEDGGQIDSIDHTQTHYTTANTSQFLTRQEAMMLYRQEAENREQAFIATVNNTSTATDTSGVFDDQDMIILAGLAIGALLVVYGVARFSPQGRTVRRMMK